MCFGELSSAGTHICKAGKNRKTHDEMQKLLLPRYVTYKEDPQIRGNGRATQDAHEDKAQGPPVSHIEEDAPRGGPPGVGRPQGSAEPGLIPIQVQLDVE